MEQGRVAELWHWQNGMIDPLRANGEFRALQTRGSSGRPTFHVRGVRTTSRKLSGLEQTSRVLCTKVKELRFVANDNTATDDFLGVCAEFVVLAGAGRWNVTAKAFCVPCARVGLEPRGISAAYRWGDENEVAGGV